MQVKFKLVYLDKHYVVLWPETDLNENIKKALGQKILCFVSSRSDLRVTMCYTVKNPTSMNLWFIDQKNIIIYFSVINVRCINKEIVYYTLHGSFLVSWIDCKIILCYIFQKVLISRGVFICFRAWARNLRQSIAKHSFMPSPLAPDPIRVQSCVCCLCWTSGNSMAVTSIFLSISFIQLELWIFLSALSVHGNTYFYWNYREWNPVSETRFHELGQAVL